MTGHNPTTPPRSTYTSNTIGLRTRIPTGPKHITPVGLYGCVCAERFSAATGCPEVLSDCFVRAISFYEKKISTLSVLFGILPNKTVR
jgi:hypothetical protein